MIFSILDYIILTIIFLSIIVGISRGVFRETLSLVTWVASLFLAVRFAPDFMGLFRFITSNGQAQYISTLITIFLIVLIVGTLVSRWICRALRAVGFGFFDRLFGLVFGAVRGGVLVVILLLIVQSPSLAGQKWTQNSTLAPYFNPAVRYFDYMMPDKFASLRNWLINRVSA